MSILARLHQLGFGGQQLPRLIPVGQIPRANVDRRRYLKLRCSSDSCPLYLET
jgi:hypothetical protein